MTQEHNQSQATAATPTSPDHDDHKPGRGSRSALLRKPDHAVASGLVSRKARDASGVADGADHAVAAASSSSGSPLPDSVMRKFESSLGADLSGIRVHTGEASATANEAVGAKAYTMGNDIHFGAGHYDPASPAGEHLLAHEVAHTVQQGGGAQRMQFELAVSSPGDHHEAEADRAADAMVSGGPSPSLTSLGGAPVQRLSSYHDESDTEKGVPAGRKDAQSELPQTKGADEDADKQWQSINGDDIITSVRAACLAWSVFRKNPHSGGYMPGASALRGAIKKMPEAAFSAHAWLREYASKKLGPADLSLLQELHCMDKDGLEVSTFFNVQTKDVKHHYTISFDTNYGITKATLTYTNNLPSPWKWTKIIAMTGCTFNANVLGGGSMKPDAGLSVSGSMKADTVVYNGWEDFTGLVSVLGFPSVGVKTPLGGVSKESGTSIVFHSGIGDVSFTDLALKPMSQSDEGGEAKKGAEVSINLFSMGAGVAKVDNASGSVDTKDVASRPRLIEAAKQWTTTIKEFATGKAELPGDGASELAGMVKAMSRFYEREVKPSEAGLKQHDIDPADNFKPSITAQGWATARWAAAASDDAKRFQLNHELSGKRADAALAALVGVWGPWSYAGLKSMPMGPGAFVDGVLTPETKINEQIIELEKELAVTSKGSDEAKALEAKIKAKKAVVSPTANEEAVRQVTVVVEWKGKLCDLAGTSTKAAFKDGGAAPGTDAGNTFGGVKK